MHSMNHLIRIDKAKAARINIWITGVIGNKTDAMQAFVWETSWKGRVPSKPAHEKNIHMPWGLRCIIATIVPNINVKYAD